MMTIKNSSRVALALLISSITLPASAMPFFYVGASGGDFFDESNWNSAPDGSGSALAGDPLTDSPTGAIGVDLVIDGDTVVANGQVDFGTGSLSLTSGSSLSVTGAGNDLDINADSTFTLNDATVEVEDSINLEGNLSLTDGSVTSLTGIIAFQDSFISLLIDGTTFVAADNIYFDGFTGSITDASFTSSDRLGVRNNVAVVATNTTIEVNGGTGDIDDVFGAAGTGSSLQLLGVSTLLADSIEEGADLSLGGSTQATMGGGGFRIVADGSTITVETTDVILNVGELDATNFDFVDARPFLINGLTGLSYATDPNAWNVSNWNGSDSVTLQLVSSSARPVPASNNLVLVLLASLLAVVGIRRYLV